MYFYKHNFSPTYETLKPPTSPSLEFSEIALKKQWEYVSQSDAEVGWMGFARKTGKMVYTIDNVFLMPQIVSGTTTEIIPEIWFELAKEMSEDDMKKVRFWGHSHVNMSCVPSGTDKETMTTLSHGTGWFIRTICNKKGEMKNSIYLHDEALAFHDVPWKIAGEKIDVKFFKQIKEELEKKVTKKKTWYRDSYAEQDELWKVCY